MELKFVRIFFNGTSFDMIEKDKAVKFKIFGMDTGISRSVYKKWALSSDWIKP